MTRDKKGAGNSGALFLYRSDQCPRANARN
jgi:hypothetical protein